MEPISRSWDVHGFKKRTHFLEVEALGLGLEGAESGFELLFWDEHFFY